MRITEGSLAFSASHAFGATLEGHHSVTAWAGNDRLQQSQDARITMSGADAATQLQRLAGSNAYAAASSASVAHARALVRKSASHDVHGPAIAPGQLTAGLTAHASGAASGSSGSSALSGKDALWLMLLQISGSKEAAADLADRLARFAAHMQHGSGIAETLRAVADANPTVQPAQAQPAEPPQPDWGYREDASFTVTETEQTGDHNGWIDEADAAWSQLGLWTGESGRTIQSLGASGVGAIATGSVATPFSLGAAGQLAASGVYLHENGAAGVVGELDLYA